MSQGRATPLSIRIRPWVGVEPLFLGIVCDKELRAMFPKTDRFPIKRPHGVIAIFEFVNGLTKLYRL